MTLMGRDLTLIGRDLLAVAAWGRKRRALVELPFAVSHASPEDVRFVTEDIPRFWQAFDAARADGRYARALERHYFSRATTGLREFRHRRPEGFARLGRTVSRLAAFYDSIRNETLRLHEDQDWREGTRAHLRALHELLPEARFPDVYVTIGGLFTAGTAGLGGVFLAAEFLAGGARVHAANLNAWERGAVRGARVLPFLILHELAHTLQRRANPNVARGSLLGLALEEGTADFLARLVTGETPRTPYFRYGVQHEARVWRDFQRGMHGRRYGAWFYQGRNVGERPADLGYFVGYRIAEQYYRQAADPARALRDLLDIHDPLAVLRASGYAGGPRGT